MGQQHMFSALRFRSFIVLAAVVTAYLVVAAVPARPQDSAPSPAKTTSVESGTAESGDDGSWLLRTWNRFMRWRNERIAKTDTYVLAVQGPGYAALQDTRMTPLVYRALGGALSFEDRTYRPEEIVLTRFFFQYSHVLSDGALDGDFVYQNPRGSGSLTYLRRFQSIPLSLGATLDVTGNVRTLDPMGNSRFNYDVITSLSPAARWEDSFTLFGRDAGWHVGVSVPVVAYVIRNPVYNLSYQKSAAYLAAPWTYYRLRLHVGVDGLLKYSNENRWALDYHYDFYGLREDPHRLTMGLHTLTIGYALKTK